MPRILQTAHDTSTWGMHAVTTTKLPLCSRLNIKNFTPTVHSFSTELYQVHGFTAAFTAHYYWTHQWPNSAASHMHVALTGQPNFMVAAAVFARCAAALVKNRLAVNL